MEREIIFDELHSADEFYFITKGRWDVGYELNKIKRYRL